MKKFFYKLKGIVLIVISAALVIAAAYYPLSSLTRKGAEKAENGFAETYVPQSALISAPTVAAEIKDAGSLTALLNDERAATAIVCVDEYLNVIDADGLKLGGLDIIYAKYMQGRVIPAVYVKDVKTAVALARYLAKDGRMTDAAVISDDTEALLTVRKAVGHIRGILDWSGSAVKKKADWSEVVSLTHSSYANVAVLSAADASYDAVNYIQSRLITVWTRLSGDSLFCVAEAASSGALGIVTQKPGTAYAAFGEYNRAENPLSRAPFNVAHRGEPDVNFENSMEGFIQAYENGATHIETDGRLTKDGQIVIMHDATINRTTNYTGVKSVSEMTLEEIKGYRITKNYGGEEIGGGAEIPSADELFSYFSDKEIVIAFEIKSGEEEFAAILKEKLTKYGITDKVFAISFSTAQIEKMNEVMPEIPTAYLGYFTESGLPTALAQTAALNTCPDSFGGSTALTAALKDRGYMSFYWTYRNVADVNRAILRGVAGITNNGAHSLNDYARNIYYNGEINADGRESVSGREYAVECHTYGGETVSAVGSVFLITESADGLYVILKSEFTHTSGIKYTLFSGKVKVVFPDA